MSWRHRPQGPGDFPTNAEFQRDLSIAYERLADLAAAHEENDEAIARFEASLTVWRRLARSDAIVSDYRYGQRVPLLGLATLRARSDPNMAMGHLADALAAICEVGDTRSGDPAWRQSLETATREGQGLLDGADPDVPSQEVTRLAEQLDIAGALLNARVSPDDATPPGP